MTLASEALGIIAKIDLVESEDGTVTPVDTKKGKRPHVAEGAYEPERVQVCAQALILEDAGYRVGEGAIWYAGSRERVRIALDETLRARTRAAISELRLTAATSRLPSPLVDSPKCTRCSLAGICLPDEIAFFRRGAPPAPAQPVGRYRSAALRALGLTVPLFAAVASFYSDRGAYELAPRLMLLDEAFAGIDDAARAHCMGLICAFDLDFVITSEREWACYAELAGRVHLPASAQGGHRRGLRLALDLGRQGQDAPARSRPPVRAVVSRT